MSRRKKKKKPQPPGEPKVVETTVVGASTARPPPRGGGDQLKLVTFDQYETGYQLFMGLPPGRRKIQAIMDSAKLTQWQVNTLMTRGYPKGKPEPWPAWSERLTGEVLELQSNACEVARDLSKRGVTLFQLAMGNTQRAQMVVASILNVYAQRVTANAQLPDGQRMPVEKIMPGPAVRETLAALRPYADMTNLGRAFQEIYGGPNRGKSAPVQAPPEMYVDLSGDYGVRGGFAFAALTGDEDNVVDVLDELMPEMAGWTTEEIEHFAVTGERPEPKAVA